MAIVVQVEIDDDTINAGLTCITNTIAVQIIKLDSADAARNDRRWRELNRCGTGSANIHCRLQRTPRPGTGTFFGRAGSGHMKTIVNFGNTIGGRRTRVGERDRHLMVQRSGS